MSFTRRYKNWPGTQTLALIEGVVIIDSTPLGNINGVGTGVVGLVGEFQDCSASVKVSPAGVVTSDYKATQIFGSQNLLDTIGGFDETLGDFGGGMGNGFVELRNKAFAGLVLVPINIASSAGVRIWRYLPVCKGATDPTPAQPIQGGYVSAGRQFSASSLLRLCSKVQFADTAAYISGINGVITNMGAPAAFGTFTRAAGSWGTDGVKKGQILVFGTAGTPAAGTPAATSTGGTYRVISVTNDTDIVIERLDGTVFDYTTASNIPWRMHASNVADSGGANQLSDAGGYVIPARPLSASITGSTLFTPSVTPPAQTALVWDTLSGLGGSTIPTTGLVYTAGIQAGNQADATLGLDAEYQKAFDCLLAEADPANLVSTVWAARKSAAIAATLLNHCTASSAAGHGRIEFVSPALSGSSHAQITPPQLYSETAYPGAGASPKRDERCVMAWPGVRTLVPEAIGIPITGADGNTYTDGIIDVTWDGWEVALCSTMPPERSIGEEVPPATTILTPVLDFQRNTPVLAMPDYIQLKAKGISAPFHDKSAGFVVQSAVTTSLISGETNINRRRFADFFEDSIATILRPFSKQLLTESLKDQILTELYTFCGGLVSEDNPAAQRMAAFSIDATSLNTPAQAKAGIYALDIGGEMLQTADVIAAKCAVGLGVVKIG